MGSPLFYSTNLKSEKLTFSKALLKGIAPDKGLFMPVEIPVLSKSTIDSFSNKKYYEIAFEIARTYMTGEISDDDLFAIVKDAYNYEVPLENVYENKYVMRLDQGPTASFKDFAARMMARLIQYFLKLENRSLRILTATSGDTGSAIANAFYELDNIEVVVLFPETEVTARQRKQMTTLGKNVEIISINAKFDDCQALVKQAFADSDLDKLNLSSANSINIGRLVPQIVYYFYSFAKLRKGNSDDSVYFSVPSGNFGNMMGGMLAKRMGLPVSKFIISTNRNDEFPLYVESGDYNKIEPSINCISSAMNVGHPSNLSRLVALFTGIMDEQGNISKQANLEDLRNNIFAISINDQKTRETISEAYQKYRLLLEPHGAVGWAGLEHFLNLNKEIDKPEQLFISLETAHPAKFPEEINKILGIDPELPPSLQNIEEKEESYLNMDNNYIDFKNYLLSK
ncbi:threonine synthase [Bacteroidota bacterium]